MDEYVIEIPGFIYSYGYGKNYLKYMLNKAGSSPVRIQMNSLGGDVNEALAMFNLIKEHGNVILEMIAFNASCATWLGLAAKSIEAHEDSLWMAHNCSVPVDIYGNLNAEDLDSTIKKLESDKKSAEAIDLIIAKKYADKCGKKMKDILDLMTEERWMTAQEALQWGFVDRIIPADSAHPAINSKVINQIQAFGLPAPILDKTKDPDDKLEKRIEDSVYRRFLNGMRELFGNNQQMKPINDTIMNEEFAAINGILKVQGLPQNNGMVTLTVDQMKVINRAITDAVSSRTTAENAHKKLVDGLNALSDTVKNASTDEAKLTEIQNILSRIPSVNVDMNKGAGNGSGEKVFTDIAVDPINRFENE